MAMAAAQLKVLRKFIHHGALTRVPRLVHRVHPADLAETLESLPPAESRQVIEVLCGSHQVGNALRLVDPATLDRLLGRLSDATLARLVDSQPSDDALYFFQRLSRSRQQKVGELLDPDRRSLLERLERYPDNAAGQYMTTQVVALPQQTTVAEALAEVRRQGRDLEAVYYLYVVDEEGVLTGVVSFRQLLVAPEEGTLGELMTPEPVAAHALDHRERVAAIVTRYGFLSVPVIDDRGRLVGAVTVDDVVDFIQEDAEEDLFLMAGIAEEDRVSTPVLHSVRRRIVWSALNVGTAMVASTVITLFEGSIEKVVVLATFMPVVAGLGGNAGSQALTVMIRSLATGDLVHGDQLRAVLRQGAIGLILGCAAGVGTGLSVWLWKGNPWLGLILFFAMVVNMAIGALVGATVPLVLRALKQDPAAGSGILVTGMTDSLGFMVFLGLSTFFLVHLIP